MPTTTSAVIRTPSAPRPLPFVQALGEDGQHQHDGADDLGGEVLHRVADLRAGGEDAQHRAGRPAPAASTGLDRVLRAGAADDLPVGEVGLELAVVGDPDQRGADHGAEHLADEVDRDVAPVAGLDGEAEGHGRVEMGAGERRRCRRPVRTAKPQPKAMATQPALRALERLERHGGADAAAEQDEHGGTDGLADEDVGAGHPRLLCPSSRGSRTRVPPGVRALGEAMRPLALSHSNAYCRRCSTMPTDGRESCSRVTSASRVPWSKSDERY